MLDMENQQKKRWHKRNYKNQIPTHSHIQEFHNDTLIESYNNHIKQSTWDRPMLTPCLLLSSF